MNTTINNNTNFQAGLYFYQKTLSGPAIWYEKSKYGAISDISEEGIEYIPDLTLSNELKERVANNPFIKILAGQVDTFVNLTIKEKKKTKSSDRFIANIAITWNDVIGHTKETFARSKSSSDDAVNKLLDKVTNKEFIVNDLM